MTFKKNRKFIASLASAALVSTVVAPVAGASFTTTTSLTTDENVESLVKEAVAFLTEQGIMESSNGDFAANSLITRGEIAKAIAVSLGLVKQGEKVNTTIQTNFSDVNGHEAAPYIQVLVEKGILAGYSDGTFKPDQELRRDELAKILVTAFDLKTNNKVKVSLKDSNNWAKGYIHILASNGIDIGLEKGIFDPASKVTNSSAALLLHRTIVEEVRVSSDKNLLVETPQTSNHVVSIMHNNDTHAHLDNMPKTVTAIKEYRTLYPNALLLNAGDVFSGTLYFNTFAGKADLALMNLMGYDAMTFGNHEFDLGSSPEGHQALVDFIQGAKFPFISSNIDFAGDAKFTGLFSDLLSSSPENGKIYNGMIKEINGEKVGIFGLTTAETAGISSPGAVEFEDYLIEAEKAVKAFEGMGINKIIALTHIGYDDNVNVDNDLRLAEAVPGIDVIVGGHTHTTLNEPVIVTKDSNGKEKAPTVIVQAYQYNDYLGTLDVEFDKNGIVVNANGRLVKIADYTADSAATKVLEPLKLEMEKVSQSKIGVTIKEKLVNPRTSDKDNTTGASVRANETVLGNLITDGMLEKAKQYDKDIILALQNGGGIRSAMDVGPVTLGQIRNVLSFGNTLATMEITGAELKEALEWSLREYPKENGGFLHIAGGKVEFDSTKSIGERVVSISYKDAEGNFIAIEDAKLYKVATNFFTAKGGDSYSVFEKLYTAGKVTDLGLVDWENFRDYLISIKDNIPTTTEGRIVNVKAAK